MNFKLVTSSFIVGAFALSTGCASLITDNATQVSVKTSNGQDAKVFVDGQPYQVPGLVMAKKDGQEKIITVESEGCAKSAVLQTEIEPAFFGNILIGGLLGSTTDNATGKMWAYQESITIQCSGS